MLLTISSAVSAQQKPMTGYAPVNGLKMYYEIHGSGEPVVLLHGFQDCGDTWQFLVDSLPGTWSLVAPDWRGFGGSEWAPGGYWFPDYLADLETLLDQLVPDAPTFTMVAATDAIHIDSSRLNLDQVIAEIERIVTARLANATAP